MASFVPLGAAHERISESLALLALEPWLLRWWCLERRGGGAGGSSTEEFTNVTRAPFTVSAACAWRDGKGGGGQRGVVGREGEFGFVRDWEKHRWRTRRNDFDRAGGRTTFGGRRPEANTEETRAVLDDGFSRRARTLDVASWTMPRTCFSRSLRKGMCTR